MKKNNFCIIMAGGIGSRFWPMSTADRPKQFLDICGSGETLIQNTVKRFERVCPSENIFIVTNERYKELIMEQLPQLTEMQIICEPFRRNTAPCIAYANYKIRNINPDANIVVAPSDHIILNEDEFIRILNVALDASAKTNALYTLGINPSRPETGYGYIQFDELGSQDVENKIYKVKTFTEKPIYEMAVQFLQSGDFLWNSGLFIWNLKAIDQAFRSFLPEIYELFDEGVSCINKPSEDLFIRKVYEVCRSISIDYGIMEKADNVFVLASDFGWSDLGTWGSLHELRKKDENQNVITGKNIKLYDTKNSIVSMPKDKLVVIQGLDDYIVVENNNVLLICKKQDEQLIRQFVNDVQAELGDKYI
ncbi:MAG: mannose-1-phosphate guanylyltransferase [Bacteroidales bacterium]|nr:mannose-1-phosphate guanylyltransferase [Bacteroidales bacterium]MDD4575025.1 mannose-1-phosphate guanylyltransferase [Bacteroidales bacterium]